MRQERQTEDDSFTLGIVVLCLLISAALLLNWYLQKTLSCNLNCWFLKLRLAEIYPLASINGKYQQAIQTVTAILVSQPISFGLMYRINAQLFREISYCVAFILTISGVWFIFWHPLQKVRKQLSPASLRGAQEKNWPCTAPFANLNLVQENVEGYAYSCKPGEFSVRHGILTDYKEHLKPSSLVGDDEWYRELVQARGGGSEEPVISAAQKETLDKWSDSLQGAWQANILKMIEQGRKPEQELKKIFSPNAIFSDGVFHADRANEVFVQQLGPKYIRFDLLAPHQKALFGIFSVAALGNHELARNLLSELSLSYRKGISFQNAIKVGEEYCKNPQVLLLIYPYGYISTVLMRLFEAAKNYGKLASGEMVGWLKPTDRTLFYALNWVGSPTGWVEAAGPIAHFLAEKTIEEENSKIRKSLGPVWTKSSDLHPNDLILLGILSASLLNLPQTDSWIKSLQGGSDSQKLSTTISAILPNMLEHPRISQLLNPHKYVATRLLALRYGLFENGYKFPPVYQLLKGWSECDSEYLDYCDNGASELSPTARILWGEFLEGIPSDSVSATRQRLAPKKLPQGSAIIQLEEPMVGEGVRALHEELLRTGETKTALANAP